MMNCEEFEMRGLDLDRNDAEPPESAAANEHARVCASCCALLESWREVKSDLRLLREETRTDSAPARVEMRLKQELRTRREARVPRNKVAIAAWVLAGAAVLAASVGWMRSERQGVAPGSGRSLAPGVSAGSSSDGSSETLLAADHDTGEFTQLPGSLLGDSGDQAVLEVRLQRGALGRFGLPVEPEYASEWVNVDFLVGEDGQPQAVRLHEEIQAAVVTR